MISAGKYKFILMMFAFFAYIINAIVIFIAFYTIETYWIFVVLEIVAIVVFSILIMVALRFEAIVDDELSLLIKNSTMKIADEDVQKTINKIISSRKFTGGV